jgi:hypothetical protein
MEIVLEEEEVLEVLRAGLRAQGVETPEGMELVLRRNNKRGTTRVVLKTPEKCGK